MNTQLINQIKELPGVKEVTLVNDVAVVVFEPRKPIYTDPEDGTEFFKGDACWWFLKAGYNIRSNYINNINVYCGSDVSSKIYKSRQLCELALAKFIMDKYK